jgi:hypothetical protein
MQNTIQKPEPEQSRGRNNNGAGKGQRLNLPFVKRRQSPVAWIYNHRAGVYSLVILALVMAILFVTSRIIVRTPRGDETILVDMRTVEELRQEAQRLQLEVRMRQSEADAQQISNAISNAGAELADDRNTDMSNLRQQIDGNEASLRGNRDAWNEGLREIEAIKNSSKGKGDEAKTNNDTRARGRVLVEYLLTDPLRQRDELPVPGYRCEKFGVVVVDIVVDNNGRVVAAKVNEAQSDRDLCMHETALGAAFRSRFNIDTAAPDRHAGTITYTFVAQ